MMTAKWLFLLLVRISGLVVTSCGVCDMGEDCISVGGTSCCADPCQHYTILNDDWRATNNNANVNGEHCDQSINWQGWYCLFLGNTSVQMPERCVDSYMYGTAFPMWLTDPHPQLLDRVVQRGVCGSWSGDCCSFRQNPIHVKACYGNYYVYKFVPAINSSPLDRPGNGVVRVGAKARASMSLYLNSNYTEPYPAGRVTLPVGSTLHVGVSVEESEAERYVVVLDNYYATESPSPDDLPRFYIIQHRSVTLLISCLVEESGSSLRARFSALLFLYQGDYRDVFLHCSLSLCDQRRSSCSPVCSRRRSRSVSKSIRLKLLTIGPITCNIPYRLWA
uniref:ZP domain-containing protein n=1 Tax=Salmo trutta TaxID=8032 RepID=A0A674DKU6_SALTR